MWSPTRAADRRAPAVMVIAAVGLCVVSACGGATGAVFACETNAGCADGFVCDPVARVCVPGGIADAITTTTQETTDPDTTPPDTTEAETTETVVCVAGSADVCFIGGECFAEGDAKPGEPCLRCRPTISTTEWTAAPSGPCDDGNDCTTDSECVGGTCKGTPIADTMPCSSATTCAPSVCMSGACEAHFADRGTPCIEDGDSCSGDGRCVQCLTGDECDSTVCASDGHCDPGWPFATDPSSDKVVTGDEVIPAGSIVQYRNLTIAKGATLAIVGPELGPGLAWTIIGVRGTLRLDGRITGASGEVTGTAEARGPRAGDCAPGSASCGPGDLDGERLFWTTTQQLGGDGGGVRVTGTHSDQSAGNGGGGAGGPTYASADGLCSFASDGSTGGDGTEARGGDGGFDFHSYGEPGVGAMSFGGDGGIGRDGGGGGGGKRGRHGQPVYFKVLGEVVGDGRVELGGEDGGDGGSAEGAHDCVVICLYGVNRGCGGGGGAGGNGGALARRGAVWPPTITVVLKGGAPGLGGGGGACDTDRCGADGQPGTDGELVE